MCASANLAQPAQCAASRLRCCKLQQHGLGNAHGFDCAQTAMRNCDRPPASPSRSSSAASEQRDPMAALQAQQQQLQASVEEYRQIQLGKRSGGRQSATVRTPPPRLTASRPPACCRRAAEPPAAAAIAAAAARERDGAAGGRRRRREHSALNAPPAPAALRAAPWPCHLTIRPGPVTSPSAVPQELKLLAEDAAVYKMIGPALVRQEPGEAAANVGKRLEFIGGACLTQLGLITLIDDKCIASLLGSACHATAACCSVPWLRHFAGSAGSTRTCGASSAASCAWRRPSAAHAGPPLPPTMAAPSQAR